MVRKQQKNEIFTTYDLHGYKLEDAIDFIENLIGTIRLAGNEEIIKVITGRGIIRTRLKKYLEAIGVDHRFEHGNDGVIIILVD